MADYQQKLLEAAMGGVLVLTANRRFARHLREYFDQQMMQSGTLAWRTPQIMSLESWLHSCLEKSGLAARLLEPSVALRLWEYIVAAESAPGADSALLRRLGNAAMEAHRLLEEYGAAEISWPLSPDQEAFLRWRRRYLRRLEEENWLDPALVTVKVAQLVGQGELTLPSHMILAGFDELTPHVRQLLVVARERGVLVEEAPPPIAPRGEAVRISVDGDRQSEIRMAARWVRSILEAGGDGIGIVVPDMHLYRKDIERILREELDPQSLVTLTSEEHHFSLSLGAPLRDLPPVRAALEILALEPKTSLDRAGFLLRSPFLGGAEQERFGRGLCEVRLRRRGKLEVSLASVAREALAGPAEQCLPILAGIMKRLADLTHPGRLRRPGEWAEQFLVTLAAAGWPGERPLSSSEYQVCQAMRDKLIRSLSAFDRVTGAVTKGEAFGLLQQLAAEREFQPEAPAGPVQVIGYLEAGGLTFQHLWLLGLTSDALPQAVHPNPLLPIPLQIRRNMPHSSPERELEFARGVLERSLAAAPRVIASHPSREGDAEVLPSPLLAGFSLVDQLPLADSRSPFVVWQDRVVLETYVPGNGPKQPVGTVVRGGVGVLRDQAQCPFQAFARHRLGARTIEEPEPGIDLATRGNLLHRALEYFWAEVKGSAGLQALSSEALQQQVAASVDSALNERQVAFADEPTLLHELEQERLQQLLFDWLVNVEAIRPGFVVEQLEDRQMLEVGGLKLEGRIDRIDRLDDDTRLFIDYKSGRLPHPEAISGDPLLEPQLPAYAVCAEEPPGGVLLAGVKRGDMNWLGVGKGGGLPRGVTELPAADWQRQIEIWRCQVQGLGEAFRKGEATVAPVDREQSCRQCDLAVLCRIGDLSQNEERGGEA